MTTQLNTLIVQQRQHELAWRADIVLTATTLWDNRPARALLRSLGFRVVSADGNELDYARTFAPSDPTPFRGRRTRLAGCLAAVFPTLAGMRNVGEASPGGPPRGTAVIREFFLQDCDEGTAEQAIARSWDAATAAGGPRGAPAASFSAPHQMRFAVALPYGSVGVVGRAAALRVRSTAMATAIATSAIVMSSP